MKNGVGDVNSSKLEPLKQEIIRIKKDNKRQREYITKLHGTSSSVCELGKHFGKKAKMNWTEMKRDSHEASKLKHEET